MPISDEELTAIRQRPAYRAALWLGRLAALPYLALFAVAVLAMIDGGVSGRLADAAFAVGWLVLLMFAGAGFLLWRAGVPFERDGWSGGTVPDPKLNRAITSDFFFRRR